MSSKCAALAAAILAVATPSGGANVIDGTSNTIMFLTGEGPAAALLKAPGLPWQRYDLVRRVQNPQALIGVSLSAAGVALHSGAGGSAPVTTALFFTGAAALSGAPFTLRDQRSGLVTLPSAARTVAVDPSDPSGHALLISAGHVVLPGTNQVRGVNLVRDGSGEAVLVDYDFTGGAPRRTPLGYTPPLGTDKGSVVVAPNGHGWATFPYEYGVALFDVGDLATQGPLEPTLLGTVAGSASFDRDSTHLGIIAILIGLSSEPRPSISLQDGDQLRLYVHDGVALRLVSEQRVASGASGLIEEQGLFYYFVSQGVLWRGIVGEAPEAAVNLGR